MTEIFNPMEWSPYFRCAEELVVKHEVMRRLWHLATGVCEVTFKPPLLPWQKEEVEAAVMREVDAAVIREMDAAKEKLNGK